MEMDAGPRLKSGTGLREIGALPVRRRDRQNAGSDGERDNAQRLEREAAEEREAGSREGAEEVVEPEQAAALRRPCPVGELGRRGDERDVPADPEAEEEERRHGHAAEPLEPERG